MSREKDYFQEEEQFHSQDKKLHRKERKQAIAQDRSKYKKSDQDQLKKRVASSATESTDHLKRGRILAIHSEGIIVDHAGTLLLCHLKGSLKKEKERMKNLVAVGDYVLFTPTAGDEGVIAHVEERRSFLSRADNLARRKEQLIAVNIDQVLITTSVVLPPLKPFLVDRYIIAARKGNMEPIIVVNKIDLFDHPPDLVDQIALAEEKALFEEFLEAYKSLNIPIYVVSATTGSGLSALKQAMQGKTSVFSGQSGVGKSSLINQILGTKLNIGKIVEKTSKGSHTTTMAHLIPLEEGGFCIDTPGIKSFGIWDLQEEELQDYFPDIAAKRSGCKYPDCKHQQEPQCAVKAAVENREISPLRFASYCALIASIAEEHRHR